MRAAVLLVFVVGCSRREVPVDDTKVGEPVQITAASTTGQPESYLAAVRREQVSLRARVVEEIAVVDKRILALQHPEGASGDPDSAAAATLGALIVRRQRLRDDVVSIDRADERGWDELKAEIEHDLAQGPSKS